MVTLMMKLRAPVWGGVGGLKNSGVAPKKERRQEPAAEEAKMRGEGHRGHTNARGRPCQKGTQNTDTPQPGTRKPAAATQRHTGPKTEPSGQRSTPAGAPGNQEAKRKTQEGGPAGGPQPTILGEIVVECATSYGSSGSKSWWWWWGGVGVPWG